MQFIALVALGGKYALVVRVLFAYSLRIVLAVLTAVDVNLAVDALAVSGFEEARPWAFRDAVRVIHVFTQKWHLYVALDTFCLVDAF